MSQGPLSLVLIAAVILSGEADTPSPTPSYEQTTTAAEITSTAPAAELTPQGLRVALVRWSK